MKIKLIFNAQFVGKIEEIVIVDNFNESDLSKLFFKYIGVAYDENCTYGIIE